MSKVRRVETDDVTFKATVSREEADVLRDFLEHVVSYNDIKKIVNEKKFDDDMASVVDGFFDELFDALE